MPGTAHALVAALVSLASVLAAQQGPATRSDPSKRPPGPPEARAGYWLPDTLILETFAAGTTPAERAAAADAAIALEHILRNHPALATPVGFVARAEARVGSDPEDGTPPRGQPLPYTVRVAIWIYAYGDSTDFKYVPWELTVAVNQPKCLGLRPLPAGASPAHGGTANDMDFAPSVTDMVGGFPRYSSDPSSPSPVVLSRSLEPPWVPVTNEAFLRHQIAAAGGVTAAGQRAAAMDAKGMQDREQALENLRNTNPQLADSMARVLAQLDQQAAQVLHQEPGTGTSGAPSLQTELDALSPEERKAPAHTDVAAPWPSGLAHGSGPTVLEIVRPNPAFFDPALPRSAPQLACVTFDGTPDEGPFASALFDRAVKQFPWRAVSDWIHSSR
jgi:hypothetical protein